MELSLAVIGAGNWGKNLVRNFFELGHLAIIGDTNPQTLEKYSREYPKVKCTTEIGALLSDKSIDGVVIATPAETHGKLAKEALLSGKDVLVEKPLCLDISLGEELVKISREKKKILMVGHLLHFHPAIIRLKEMIKDGALGKIQYIYSNRLNFGMFRSQENVLWSFAPHDISVILGLTGEMPESVQTISGNYLHHKISDVTMTHLSFPSGVKGHVFVTWLNAFKEQRLVVMGDKQMAVFDDLNPWETKLVLYPHEIKWNSNIPTANKAQGRAVPLNKEEPLRNECLHFIECIRNRFNPLTDGQEGLRVLKVLKDSQLSIDLQKTIKHPENGIFIHESAIVDENCTIGTGSKIWHFSHILQNSRIGENCTIGQNVVIGPNVTIGNHCKIQNNISIYDGVTLEDEVFCGPSVVFTNVNIPRSAMNRRNEFKKTWVKKGATLGANATVVCGHTIGSYAFIGAGAVVTHDVPDYALMTGNPARQKGWSCSCGQRLNDDLTCPSCLKKFKREEYGLTPITSDSL